MIKLIISLALCFGTPSEFDNPCRVKKVHTPVTQMEMAQALKKSHFIKFGKLPSKKRLAVAWSQIALENGQGYYTYNYNFGKIKSSKNRLYYIQRHRFRAHSNIVNGMLDYWDLINRLCNRSLSAFDTGAPEHAANILYGCGYYGADKTRYGQEMRKLYGKAMRELIPKIK